MTDNGPLDGGTVRRWFIWLCVFPVIACQPQADGGAFQIDTLESHVIQTVSTQPTWSDTTDGWHFQEVMRFGADDGSPGELAGPRQIAVDDLGRLYVSDSRPAAIKVFSKDGRFLRTIGREGGGPGEFYVPFIAVRGRLLAVHDPRNARTSVFDTSGTFLSSWPSSCCVGFPIHIDTASRIYVPTSRASGGNDEASPNESRGMPWVRYDSLGTILDTLFAPYSEEKLWTLRRTGPKEGVSQTRIPFTSGIVFNMHPAGGLLYGTSSEYRFVESPNGDDTTRVVARQWTPERIPDAMRTDAVNRVLAWFGRGMDVATVRSVVRLDDVPTTAPAFTGFRVDNEGNVWVMRLLGSDSTKTAFDVFAPDGRWRGPVVAPVSLEQWGVDAWGKDGLFAAVEDDDGRPVIIKFRIVK